MIDFPFLKVTIFGWKIEFVWFLSLLPFLSLTDSLQDNLHSKKNLMNVMRAVKSIISIMLYVVCGFSLPHPMLSIYCHYGRVASCPLRGINNLSKEWDPSFRRRFLYSNVSWVFFFSFLCMPFFCYYASWCPQHKLVRI